jgi:hypothetical protein
MWLGAPPPTDDTSMYCPSEQLPCCPIKMLPYHVSHGTVVTVV